MRATVLDGKRKAELMLKRGFVAAEDRVEDTTYFIKRPPWQSVGDRPRNGRWFRNVDRLANHAKLRKEPPKLNFAFRRCGHVSASSTRKCWSYADRMLVIVYPAIGKCDRLWITIVRPGQRLLSFLFGGRTFALSAFLQAKSF